MQQEALLESIEMRNRLVCKQYVLDKVKILSLFSDGDHLTIKMAAEYYEVDTEAISKIIHRHRDELNADGLEVLARKECNKFFDSDIMSISNYIGSKARTVTILNQRCVLRIGMLLRDSTVAKQVRTYLLNVEEQSTQQQKAIATRGSKWDGKDLILYDRIVVGVSEGKTLSRICKEASKELEETATACRTRYTQNIKKKITNLELIAKIEGNKRGHGFQHGQHQIDTPIENHGVRIPSWAESYFNEVVQMNIETNELMKRLVDHSIIDLKAQLEIKDNEIKKLRARNKKIADDLRQVQAVVASAIKVGVNETLQQTFKMGRNGNLERI